MVEEKEIKEGNNCWNLLLKTTLKLEILFLKRRKNKNGHRNPQIEKL